MTVSDERRRPSDDEFVMPSLRLDGRVALVTAGAVLPAMYFLGSIFAALWLAAVVVARRAEQIRVARAAAARRGGAQPGPG